MNKTYFGIIQYANKHRTKHLSLYNQDSYFIDVKEYMNSIVSLDLHVYELIILIYKFLILETYTHNTMVNIGRNALQKIC